MRIEQIDLKMVRLPLVRPFRTSSSQKDAITHILVRVVADGVVGWGECASPADPYYCPETTETCWHIISDFLCPSVIGADWETVDELTALYRLVKGNGFARAGVEMACWDLLGRRAGRSVASLLADGIAGGGARAHVAAGVSLGIERDRTVLLNLIARYCAEGYRRIKLKIAPGHDVEVVRDVRERYPDLPLQVDANSAYTLDDVATLQELDGLDLLLIEQPLAHDDIIDHARLQERLDTPICLDESIHSAGDARKAIEIGACRAINIKVSRVGGLGEARRIHDVCRARGVPVWCGGMHEFGIGRAANLAISSLPGFTLPGDVSGSDKYYREDLVEPPIRAVDGLLAVPDGPGLGIEPVPDRIDRATIRSRTFGKDSIAPSPS
jgi:O-succinylbenzoate synthase